MSGRAPSRGVDGRGEEVVYGGGEWPGGGGWEGELRGWDVWYLVFKQALTFG